MRPRTSLLLVLGILLLLSGTVFTLQGLGYVGPQSSFMFQNTAWITNGSIAIVVGLLPIILAVLLSRMKTPVKTV